MLAHILQEVFRMKTITVYLLVIVSGSCLLSGTEVSKI